MPISKHFESDGNDNHIEMKMGHMKIRVKIRGQFGFHDYCNILVTDSIAATTL